LNHFLRSSDVLSSFDEESTKLSKLTFFDLKVRIFSDTKSQHSDANSRYFKSILYLFVFVFAIFKFKNVSNRISLRKTGLPRHTMSCSTNFAMISTNNLMANRPLENRIRKTLKFNIKAEQSNEKKSKTCLLLMVSLYK